MCDTAIYKKANGYVFGKNSDRSANEPNLVLFDDGTSPREKTVHCTYLSIPDKTPRHPVLLVAPSWIWGAEMGINDAGVILGNEAVFTKNPNKKTKRLIGMDLLRLALERSGNARQAADIIVGLLSTYGQGGNCGFDKPFYYDNAYLIADPKESFILETVGGQARIKEIEKYGNISNRLTIDFEHFASRNTEGIVTFFSHAKNRQCLVGDQLKSAPGMSAERMMSILQSHDPRDIEKLYRQGSVRSVCMHQSLLGDHTTGSMIVETHPSGPSTLWITGSSTPCLSLYKPTYFGVIVPPVFIKKEDSLRYWLDREYLVRALYAGLIDEVSYQKERLRLQQRFVTGDALLFSGKPNKAQLTAFAKTCADMEQTFVEQYRPQIEQVRRGEGALPKPWNRLTARLIALNKRFFSVSLAERKKP